MNESLEPPRDPRYGLEEAVDGELPGEMIERMRAHAAHCPECADEMTRLMRIKDLLRRSCRDTVAPRSLRERITVQVRSVEITHGGTTRSSFRMSATRRVGPDA